MSGLMDEVTIDTGAAGSTVRLRRRCADRRAGERPRDAPRARARRVVMAAVEGEIDVSNAGTCSTSSPRAVPNSARGLLVDLMALEFLDSSGVHMLYELAERLGDRQQRFAVVLAPDAPPRRAIELTASSPRRG